jgi:uncharacterized membrane protein
VPNRSESDANDEVAAAYRAPILPSREDPFVAATSTLIGGPPGRRARLGDARFWIPIRVLVFFAVAMCSLSWATKSMCATHGYSHEYQYTRVCYTDVLALWSAEGLDQGKVPILDNVTPTPDQSGVVHHKYVEYPVIIGAVMGGAEGLVHLLVSDRPTASQARTIAAAKAPGATEIATLKANQATQDYQSRQATAFFDITSAFLVLCAAIIAACTGLTAGRRRIWDAALFGLAPALVLNGVVNWDLIAVAFTSAALLAWSRRAPAVAGVLLACGVATKFYPLLLLVPLFALCLRAGKMRAFGRLVAAAVVTWLIIDLPIWLANPAGFGEFYAFSRSRGTEYNSLFYAFQYAVFGANHPWDPGKHTPTWLNFWSGLLLTASLIAILALALFARRRPRLGQLAFLTVLAFLLTNKVYSPQYVLWLLPLVPLARPRWRLWLVWQATEVVLIVLLYMQLIYGDTSGNRGISYPWFFFLGDLPRDLVLLLMAAFVVREIVHPELDIVRSDGGDDPAGGVLDGAADRFTARFPEEDDDAESWWIGEPALTGSADSHPSR